MKILYGVPGEGMGHATRSKVIVAHLLKNHDVHMVSSSRAYQFLNKSFPGRVTEIEGFHLAYKNARVEKFRTAMNILKGASGQLYRNFHRYQDMDKKFTPDLVISDFESFSFLFALQHRLPIISIDNMQIISRCKLEFTTPKAEKTNHQIARNIIKAKVPGCKSYFITTFFYPPIIKDPTRLVPPILRDTIIAAPRSDGQHITVYQTSESQENLVKILQQLPRERFLVYGFNRDANYGNVQLKSFSEDSFIRDLAGGKAVLSNGGFSLISEAVYLRKPVCSVPIQAQFEQYVNAAYIEKLGYGRHLDKFAPDSLKAFIYELETYRQNLESYTQDGNREIFRALDQELGRG